MVYTYILTSIQICLRDANNLDLICGKKYIFHIFICLFMSVRLSCTHVDACCAILVQSLSTLMTACLNINVSWNGFSVR